MLKTYTFSKSTWCPPLRSSPFGGPEKVDVQKGTHVNFFEGILGPPNGPFQKNFLELNTPFSYTPFCVSQARVSFPRQERKERTHVNIIGDLKKGSETVLAHNMCS